MGRAALLARQSASGCGHVAMDKLAPRGCSGRIQGPPLQGHLAWLQRFSLSPLKETAALGVVSHLHVRGDCDGDTEVTSGGVIGIQLPVDGVQCLVFAV